MSIISVERDNDHKKNDNKLNASYTRVQPHLLLFSLQLELQGSTVYKFR
jgi:hypothetical protein